MKRSRDYYLKRIGQNVEALRENKAYIVPNLTDDVREGMLLVFNDYLLSVWMRVGDTAFNRQGYRNATDDLLEQLKQHI